MANFFCRSKGASKSGGNLVKSSRSTSTASTGTDEYLPSPGGWSQGSFQSIATLPPLPQAVSLSKSIGIMSSSVDEDLFGSYQLPRPLPAWLNPAYARHIVKGNFMTLSARPKTVEPGEWIAHQVVEHHRNLWHFVRVIYEKEENGMTICNPHTCPKMSAGPNHSYTWLNNRFEPIELPAYEYITLMQRWISGKVNDTNIFPTEASGISYAQNPAMASVPLSQLSGSSDGGDWIGKRSGFPKDFVSICKTIFLQMFRVYAHLYHAHFIEPFYHLNLEKQLNSCFSHFLLTGSALDLIRKSDVEPMQPLIDMWAANGTFPPESKAAGLANLRAGQRILQMGSVST